MRQKLSFQLYLIKTGDERKDKGNGTAEALLVEITDLDQTGPYELYCENGIMAEGDRAAIQKFLEAEVAKQPTAEEELLAETQDELATRTSELRAVQGTARQIAGERDVAVAQRDESRLGHDLIVNKLAEVAKANGELQETFEQTYEKLTDAQADVLSAKSELRTANDALAWMRARMTNFLGMIGLTANLINDSNADHNVTARIYEIKQHTAWYCGVTGLVVGGIIVGAIWLFTTAFDGCAGKPNNQPPTLSVTPTPTTVEIGKVATVSYDVTDPDDKKHDVEVVTSPKIGKVTVDQESKTLTYTSDGISLGDDTFQVVAKDKESTSPAIDVNVTVNAAPAPTPPATTGGGGTTPLADDWDKVTIPDVSGIKGR